MNTLLTKEDLMQLLKISKRTIDTMIANGELPMHTQIRRRLYWRSADVAAWIDAKFEPKLGYADVATTALARRGRPRASLQR